MKARILSILLVLALLLPTAVWAEGAATGGPLAMDAEQLSNMLIERIFASDDPNEQIELILKAAEEMPDNADMLVTCAQLLFYLDATGRYTDTCEAWLRKALSLTHGDDRVAILQTLADQLLYMGRDEEAMVLINEALESAPQDPTLRSLLATATYYAGDSEGALSLLEEIIEDSPRNLDARRMRAAILMDECRWDEALVAYQQIEEEWPEYLDGLYGQYQTYIASGQFDMGVRAIDILLGNGAEDQLWLERARIRLWKQYMPDAAIEEADALLRMNPQWIDAGVVKLVGHLMLDEIDEARAVADTIATLDSNHADLLIAIIDMNEGNWADAKDRIEKLVKRAPSAYSAWKTYAAILLDGYADPDGAMDAMAKAFGATGGYGDLDLYSQLGQIYHHNGDMLEAARAFSAADAQTFEDPSGLYYLTMTCLDAGREADAKDMLAQMERRYPGWYETMLARIIVDDTLGDSEGALAAYEAFAEKFPFLAEDLVVLHDTLLVTTGDTDALADLLAYGTEVDDADSWDAYAYGLMLSGDLDGATEYLEKAKALIPERTEETAKENDNLRISLLTTEAEILLRKGEPDAAMEALLEAQKLGWLPYSLALHEQFDTFSETRGYNLLMENAVPVPEEWDLSVMPTIPQE